MSSKFASCEGHNWHIAGYDPPYQQFARYDPPNWQFSSYDPSNQQFA